MIAPELDKYRHKIKTAEEIAVVIGPPPRRDKVIMCHGVFDIVHPGHMRHMLNAKSKAKILVASLTADKHVTKANARPYVPEDLRALNLAAFEMVDYVVIDQNPTPIRNIKTIRPDFFAKGYEYVAGRELPPKSAEEREAVEAYGGSMIFTPGDIVYSSSRIIESEPPDLAIDKLLLLMEAEDIGFDDLRAVLENFRNLSVHVVGDLIIDTFTYCSMIGGMTKTPTMSVRFENKVDYVGGAGIVAKHLQAAGASVTLSTVLGDDELGTMAMRDLAAAGIQTKAIIDGARPTTHKNAIIVSDYRMLKIDTLDNVSVSEKILSRLCSDIEGSSDDSFIFSDFRHGIFNRDTIPILTQSIPEGKFKVADSQVASRWGNILEFQGFDLITPNEREARFALGDQDSVIRPLGSMLYSRANCKNLILKMGSRGMLTYRGPENAERAFFALDSVCRNPVDPVGAGDALLAYGSLALKSSGSAVMATIIGNIAAALECEFDGNKPITPDLVAERITNLEDEAHFV